jgi:hypothetical protein
MTNYQAINTSPNLLIDVGVVDALPMPKPKVECVIVLKMAICFFAPIDSGCPEFRTSVLS